MGVWGDKPVKNGSEVSKITIKNRFALFFDLDGTLIDNEHLKARAFADAIRRFGGISQPSTYKEVMGKSGAVIARHFISEAGIEIDPGTYFQTYRSLYSDLLKSDLRIRPGAIQLLNASKDKGQHLALVSGASTDFVSLIVEALGLRHFFDFIITSEDVTHKKPHPECYLLAVEKMLVPKDQVIVFEDTEAGLEAASHTGIASIGVRHAYNQTHDLSKAIAQYSSFENDLASIQGDINSIFSEVIFQELD